LLKNDSGLISLFAEVYAASGKTAGLTLPDVQKPHTGDFLEGIEHSVVHYGSSTGFFGRKMFAAGPQYLSAAVLYENMVIESYSQSNLPFPVVAIYPKEGTEKIFRLLQALGRAYVFIDEADQAIGRRQAGDGDSGISGRIYSMLAEAMGSSSNRCKLIWILASSRPDLIEVDLKRPGRVDVKILLFPTTDAHESFEVLRTLCK